MITATPTAELHSYDRLPLTRQGFNTAHYILILVVLERSAITTGPYGSYTLLLSWGRAILFMRS